MENNYQLLIKKLDAFIRKYYKNRMLKGGIYFIGLFVVFYLLITLVEYFGHFGTSTRTVLFYLYLALNAFILWRLILHPLLQLMKIGKVISHKQAAEIIGAHFPEVKDKLLNTLELKMAIDENPESRGLIEASIEQRTKKLRPIAFNAAVDFKSNRRYLKYAIPPVIVLIILMTAAPKLVTEPTTRLVKHGTYFEESLPYSLEIKNPELRAIQQEDFLLQVKLLGEEVPEDVMINMNGFTYRLQKKSNADFEYKFANVQKEISFRLISGKYNSAEHRLTVIPKPIILDFETILDYPDYTGKTDEVIENTGDMILPVGTTVTWKFMTRDTRSVHIRLDEEQHQLSAEGSNTYEYTKRLYTDQTYSVKTENEHLINPDSLTYSVSVVPDLYPGISVEESRDSVFDKRIYFRGLIKDDYGFNKLLFNYLLRNEDGDELAGNADIAAVRLPVSYSEIQQPFFHFFNLDSVDVKPGQIVEYFFEIWDNDAVFGSKKTRSKIMTYKVPTLEEIEEDASRSTEAVKNDMEESIEEVKQLQKDIDALQRKMLEKDEIGWQEKQQIEELLNRQKSLELQIQNIQKENQVKSIKEKQYKEIDEELIRKQEELDKMFNELMDDEMKKMFEELAKMLEEVNKDELNKMLEEMKFSNEDLEKQLDRNLELFKQLEFEKKLDETIKKLDELAKEEKKLAEDTKNKTKEKEELKKEQEEINKEFDDFRKEMDDALKMNKELETPFDFEETDKKEEEIEQELQKSSEMLDQKNNKKSSEQQQNTGDQMQQLADNLMDMQNQMYSEALEEDINALREILENLIQLSFDQEELISRVNETSTADPKYVEVISRQNRVKDDIQMVEDSLFSLSKRQPMIEQMIMQETEVINKNIAKAIENLNDRKPGVAAGNQQYAMTSINNLALLLSEALKQMMNSMMMQGSGQCSKGKPKPGQGKSGMMNMRQLQEQLNKQMKQMKEGMKKGGGQNAQGGKPSMSESMARMAAEQAAIRSMMEEYRQSLKDQGLGGEAKKINELMKDMDKTETELVNKIITEEMLTRQKDILTRLLKHEKAEMEREKEEKRESKEAKEIIYSNPNEFLEYKRLKSSEIELLRTIPPNLRTFYRNKVNEYYFNFERN